MASFISSSISTKEVRIAYTIGKLLFGMKLIFFILYLFLEEIDECNSDPCVNGVCSDEIDAFSCACNDGYQGPVCGGQYIKKTFLLNPKKCI